MGFDFTLSEDTLLKVSGVSALAYSAYSLAAPREFHSTFMEKTAPLSEPAWRYMGTVGCMVGADNLVMSAKDGHVGVPPAEQEAKKDMLKVAGWGWLACAAQNVYNGYQTNTQPRDLATANAVGQGVLAGLCLWKGYE